ncbi:MAG: hypothetical protein L6406_17705 [Desulfobacterales bacterium]|nr:hypothetical protein [Desulfobacterales bacterium]
MQCKYHPDREKPTSNARKWRQVIARSAWITVRHAPTPAPIASFDPNALSGSCVGKVKRDIVLKKRQKVFD